MTSAAISGSGAAAICSFGAPLAARSSMPAACAHSSGTLRPGRTRAPHRLRSVRDEHGSLTGGRSMSCWFRGRGVWRVRGRGFDAGRGVGLVLLERLVLEHGHGEGVELVAVGAHQFGHVLVRVLDQVAHLLVDELLSDRGDVARAGSGISPFSLITVIGPITSLIPHRPTMFRASSVACLMF
jgi:hypothetical protein